MRMAEGAPGAGLAGQGADDRQHIRRAGAHPKPGVVFNRLGQWQQAARNGFGAGQLHRGFGCIIGREFSPGRQPDASAHRHQHKAAIGIHEAVIEHRIALHAVMAVIATLAEKRRCIPKTTRELRGG